MEILLTILSGELVNEFIDLKNREVIVGGEEELQLWFSLSYDYSIGIYFLLRKEFFEVEFLNRIFITEHMPIFVRTSWKCSREVF